MTDKLILTTEHRGPWLAPWRRTTVTRAEVVLERPLVGPVTFAWDVEHGDVVVVDDLGALLTWTPTLADVPVGTTMTVWKHTPAQQDLPLQQTPVTPSWSTQHRDRPEPPFRFWALWMLVWVLAWRGVYSAFDWEWGAMHWFAVLTGAFCAYCIRRVRIERRSARHQAASDG